MLLAASLAMAAANAITTDSPFVLYGIIFNGAAFVGTIVWISKKYVAKIDKIIEDLPKVIEHLDVHGTILVKHENSIKEHYECLEDHSNQLTAINTIHKIRGCDSALAQGKSR